MDLLKKKKQELVDIILRKDDVERNLREQFHDEKNQILTDYEELKAKYDKLSYKYNDLESRYKAACNDCLGTEHELFIEKDKNRKLRVWSGVCVAIAVIAVIIAIAI